MASKPEKNALCLPCVEAEAGNRGDCPKYDSTSRNITHVNNEVGNEALLHEATARSRGDENNLFRIISDRVKQHAEVQRTSGSLRRAVCLLP